MLEDWIFSVLGILFLSFRIWLVIFKLKEELEFRRFYVSRLVNFFFCFMLVFNFQVITFNVIVTTCFPAMIMTSIWDYNFYRSFKTREYWKKNRNWVLLERITMHPPVFISGLMMYILGLHYFVPSDNIWPFVIGVILVLVTSFIFDIRLRKRYNWPNGRNLLIIELISIAGFSMYYIFA